MADAQTVPTRSEVFHRHKCFIYKYNAAARPKRPGLLVSLTTSSVRRVPRKVRCQHVRIAIGGDSRFVSGDTSDRFIIIIICIQTMNYGANNDQGAAIFPNNSHACTVMFRCSDIYSLKKRMVVIYISSTTAVPFPCWNVQRDAPRLASQCREDGCKKTSSISARSFEPPFAVHVLAESSPAAGYVRRVRKCAGDHHNMRGKCHDHERKRIALR